jgi:hypothetical protein
MDDNLILLILLIAVLFGIYYYQDLIIPKILTTFSKNNFQNNQNNKEVNNLDIKPDKKSSDKKSDKVKTASEFIVEQSEIQTSVFDEQKPEKQDDVLSFDDDLVSNNSFGSFDSNQ